MLVCQVGVIAPLPRKLIKMTFDLSQSFSKNAGLYGERVGALHIVGADCDGVARIRSQLSLLQRSEIGNPPAHGARLVCLPAPLWTVLIWV